MAGEAVAVKKEIEKDEIHTLSTGVRAIIHPVSQAIIQDAVAMVPVPKMRTWYNPEKEREEENPLDPRYEEDQREYQRKLQQITFDSFALFGVDLVDGLPEDDNWIKRLKLAERRGNLDLSEFDLEDEIDLEFLYKRYIAMSDQDYMFVARYAGINEEDVQRAAASFPDDETPDADREVSADGLDQDGDSV